MQTRCEDAICTQNGLGYVTGILFMYACLLSKKIVVMQKIVLTRVKAVFHFNRIVAKRIAYSIVSKSLVLPDCSRNNEIRYVSLRYG